MRSHSYICLLPQRAVPSHPPKALLIKHNDRLAAGLSVPGSGAMPDAEANHRTARSRTGLSLSEPTATNDDDGRTGTRGVQGIVSPACQTP